MNISTIKQRFGVIGNSKSLNSSIELAVRVATTDLTVLITGESGVGKEFYPKIIHSLSHRKHKNYIAVNCGAIPQGTIDSELFGHEKGAFTGANEKRKGYFEEADKGTIFLDEVGDLPLSTQVRLLRVLESGEYMKVGSSKVQKTDVRIIAATNIDIENKISKGKFREDLFYRLNTVPIKLTPLRERKEDIHLLFRKFASDFSIKYAIPSIVLEQEAIKLIENYSFPGNIRQLKNIAEQISIIEQKRKINKEDLEKYLSLKNNKLTTQKKKNNKTDNPLNDPSFILKIFFELKTDINEIKNLIRGLVENRVGINKNDIKKLLPETVELNSKKIVNIDNKISLKDQEKIIILEVLKKHGGKRKTVAEELGISERTLYRKIKEFNLEEYE